MKLNFDVTSWFKGNQTPPTDNDLNVHASTVKTSTEEPKIESKPVDPLDPNQKLSPHFTLRELIITSHRELNNSPTLAVVERLRTLANDFLEPIRAKFGPIIISSGYRAILVNQAIGGAKDSAHMYGCAADINAQDPNISVRDIVLWVINESGLDYDQVIEEHSSTANWCHIGMLRPNHETKPRKQALIFKNGAYTIFV